MSWMKTWEIGMAAPFVMAMRLSQMAVAGANPKAADRRETRRMGQEKLDAWWEGALRSSSVITRTNLEFARLAGQAMTAGAAWPLAAFAQLGGRRPLPGVLRRSSVPSTRESATTSGASPRPSGGSDPWV